MEKVREIIANNTNYKDIIHYKFVPRGQNNTGKYYLSVVQCLLQGIFRVSPEYWEPGSWSFLHDNSPYYLWGPKTSQLSSKSWSELYPRENCLLSKLKLALKGHFMTAFLTSRTV